MKSLSDKVAIVTGSARGIGEKIAERLAREGANLALCDVNQEALQETAKRLETEFQVKVFCSVCDVSDETQVKTFIADVITAMGKIDILVNNAGITRDNLLMRMTESDWDKVIQINLRSVFLFSKEVVRPMLKQRSGRIISIASVIGVMGNAGQANYAASKAGIIAFSKSLAKEVGSRGITVNAIAPGFIQTKMTEVLTPEVREKMLEAIPLKTFGLPEDVAAMVAFLAGEDARYVTGQVLHVDGGMVMN